MPDNLERKGPEDPKKINLNQPWEVRYWTSELNVTEDELRRAVRSVGLLVARVKIYLGLR